MTTKPPTPVDLNAVREATAELEALARQHPELLGDARPQNVDAWVQVLEGLDADTDNPKSFISDWPDELMARLDAYIEDMHAQRKGTRLTRLDAVRELVEQALAADE